MSTETIITEAMSTEGAAISEIVKERRTMFRADISAKGYIVRLGNLMLQLEAIAKEAGKKKVSSKMIKEAGLSSVSSAIRCSRETMFPLSKLLWRKLTRLLKQRRKPKHPLKVRARVKPPKVKHQRMQPPKVRQQRM